jgi:hypothetical protein
MSLPTLRNITVGTNSPFGHVENNLLPVKTFNELIGYEGFSFPISTFGEECEI